MMLLVPLFSAEGKKRLEDVEANTWDYNNDLSSSSSSSSSSFPSILASSAPTITGGNSCYVQKQIIISFRKQRGNTCCGLASLAVLLTAAAAAKLQVQDRDQNIVIASRLLLEEVNDDKHYHNNNNNKKKSCPYYVDEDDVYPMVATRTDVTDDKYGLTASNSNNNAIISSPIVSDEKIRRSGMTLDQITSLASALPTTKTAIAFFPSTSSKTSTATNTATTTDTHNMLNTSNRCIGKAATADDDNNDDNNDSAAATATATATRLLSGPDELRTIICQVLSNPSSKEGLILNYHMATLGQVPFGGHLSPIAAYHQRTDTVLIMDVWHTKTEPVWATIDNIWNAISISIDGESQKPRGLLLIQHK